MELIPHIGAGELRFGMDEAALVAALGDPAQRVTLDAERTALSFGTDLDAVVHAKHGLAGITLGRGPAVLFGADLFALDRDGMEALLRPHAAAAWDITDPSTRTLTAPSLGLIVHFDEDEPVPAAVELISGNWQRGIRAG